MAIRFSLSITSPAIGATITGSSLTVKGSAAKIDTNNPDADPQPADVTVSVTGGGTRNLRNRTKLNWSTTFTLDSPGSKTIEAVSGSITRTRRITVLDKKGPVLTIDDEHLIENETDGPPYHITIKGTAIDTFSGVNRVEWKLSEQGDNSFKPTEFDPNSTKWHANVTILPGGTEPADQPIVQTVNIRATDNAGNETKKSTEVKIEVHNPIFSTIPHPGNFYTYQYTFFTQEIVERLLISLSKDLEKTEDDDNPFVLFLIKLDDDFSNPSGLPNLPYGIVLDGPPLLPELAGNFGENTNGGPAGLQALSAFSLWHLGNLDMSRGLYSRAEKHYSACRDAAVRYFLYQYREGQHLTSIRYSPNRNQQLILLLTDLDKSRGSRGVFWDLFGHRNSIISLEELHSLIWTNPYSFLKLGDYDSSKTSFLKLLALEDNLPTEDLQRIIEVPLATLIYILIPLAQAEALRQRGNFAHALKFVDQVFKPLQIKSEQGNSGEVEEEDNPLLNESIEKPFALLLKAQILLEKADREYKAHRLDNAKKNYEEIINLFNDTATYKTHIEEAVTTLKAEVASSLNHTFHPLAADDATFSAITAEDRREFNLLGKKITIPKIESETEALPGLDNRLAPQQPMLKFMATDGITNPLIYALITEAKARLLQIENGFNYLGYSDEYVPPWRFQFLLDRARYFADHAKNAQREYLNFLSNAEREELQEITASQTVEMEKSNVRIETARVEQTRREVEVAKLSQELAGLTAQNSEDRFQSYRDLAEHINDIAGVGFYGEIIGRSFSALPEPISEYARTLYTGLADRVSGGAVSRNIDRRIAFLEREFEKKNLEMAILEANKSAEIARAQLGTKQAGLVIAGMQRTAALMRHEFAVQNLNFLSNRTLNTELWYRLAGMIRSISDTYMRYAVELAFLAEQAYEFEADKRINVIRFDYDVSETGNLLAADFLLKDLDTLEQDLIVNQRERQQQVRYVLSLAREFPEALQELRDNGATILSLRLEQLERRFPGLFNIRLGAVDLLPVALMDSTRFSLELTYLGSSQVRLKASPDTPPDTVSPSPLNNSDFTDENGNAVDPWLSDELAAQWPVKIRVTGPEANIYSGLTRQEANSVFPFASTSQRHAFEGLGAAASWRIDMSMKENQVVPGSLTDAFITFTLSGYHDPDLRFAVDNVRRRPQVLTQFLSARQHFADAFYEFTQSGRMIWDVTENMLSLDAPARNLRNLGIILSPTPQPVQFSRLTSSYAVELDVTDDGQFQLLTPIPEIIINIDQLNVTSTVAGVDGAIVSFDFGDGSGFQTTNHHAYNQLGKYVISLRLVRDSRLYEYKAEIAVSRTQTFTGPLTAFPSFEHTPQGQTGILGKTHVSPGEEVAVIWRTELDKPVRGLERLLELPPGKHVVFFTAIRILRTRIYSQQRFVPDQMLDVDSLRISSNRTFELDGTETTGTEQNNPANEITEHLFPVDPQTNQRLAQSPVDRWTLEVPLDDNEFLGSVTQNDNHQVDLGGIEDAILILEYETGIK